VGLPRVLASGRVGLGAGALLLRLGLGGQRRHGGRSQQILDKLPAFHNMEISTELYQSCQLPAIGD